jgi:hypothetical protein
MYSLDDLAIAQQKFDYWADLWSKEYLENKPNIYDAEAKKASEHLVKFRDIRNSAMVEIINITVIKYRKNVFALSMLTKLILYGNALLT